MGRHPWSRVMGNVVVEEEISVYAFQPVVVLKMPSEDMNFDVTVTKGVTRALPEEIESFVYAAQIHGNDHLLEVVQIGRHSERTLQSFFKGPVWSVSPMETHSIVSWRHAFLSLLNEACHFASCHFGVQAVEHGVDEEERDVVHGCEQSCVPTRNLVISDPTSVPIPKLRDSRPKIPSSKPSMNISCKFQVLHFEKSFNKNKPR
uniref:ZP domain-containing protein n=1 Tax=Steinernema glaseri TaxID=37863 RepID=A0A1I7YQA8_9BILA